MKEPPPIGEREIDISEANGDGWIGVGRRFLQGRRKFTEAVGSQGRQLSFFVLKVPIDGCSGDANYARDVAKSEVSRWHVH